MKRILLCAISLLAMGPTGCLHPTIGPKSLPRDRALYSAGLSDSWKEQMLLNIVKMRYVDPPTFVDVGNIVATYALTQGANAGAGIGNVVPGEASGTFGAFGTYTNTPTITYTPLTGSKFIQGLLMPLPPASVFGAIQNGTPADAIMLLTLISINGLKNRQSTLNGMSPADPAFDQARTLVRKIQLSGAVRTFVKQDANKGSATVLALPTADAPPEILEDIKELRRLLKLNQEATEFTLVQFPVSSSDTEIAVMTRSVIGLMQNMAADVEVPAEDLASNRAFPGFEKDPNVPDTVRLIRIHSSKQKPADAFVSLSYRDTWFWIADSDLPSKQAFSQLILLFTMADTGPRENQPIVTIPAR